MKSRSFLILSIAVLVVAAVPAPAQMYAPPPQPPAAAEPAAEAPSAPQPSAAANTTTPGVPANPCVVPEYPGHNGSNAQINRFNRDYKAYGGCIKKYVDDNRALIDAVVSANNKAVEEYNKFAEFVKKDVEAHQ